MKENVEIENEKDEKENEKEEKPQIPEGGIKMRIFFIIFGVGSLLAWNAILSDLGFFMNYMGDYDPSTSFSFCNFLFNIIFQFIMIFKRDFLSYKVMLIFGLIASIFSLVALPLVVTSFEKNSLAGFLITAGLILFQGLVNAFCTGGFFGLTSFFPMEMIIALSTGQGVSGILMNIIGYIVLFSVNSGNEDDDAKYGAIIFFSISGLILLICLAILLFAFKSEYFKYYLGKTGEYKLTASKAVENFEEKQIVSTSSEKKENDNDEDDKEENKKEEKEDKEKDKKEKEKEENDKEENEKEEKLYEKEENQDQSEQKKIGFCQLFKQLYDIDLLSCYIYVVTFALFPSCSISQRLFTTGKYRQTTIVTIYNVFDTIGRAIISKIKPRRILCYIFCLSRTILLFTLIFNFYCDMQLGMDPNVSSILLIVNIVILATTNGMATSLCFGLAPTLVDKEYKGKAGGSISFFNILGIFTGTCIAFLTKYIMNQIGVYKD